MAKTKTKTTLPVGDKKDAAPLPGAASTPNDAGIYTGTGLPPLEDDEDDTLVDPTAKVDTPDLNLTVSTGAASTPNDADVVERDLHPNLPRIKIEYPKDFKGTKYFTDGAIVPASPEVAAQLIEQGIAKEV